MMDKPLNEGDGLSPQSRTNKRRRARSRGHTTQSSENIQSSVLPSYLQGTLGHIAAGFIVGVLVTVLVYEWATTRCANVSRDQPIGVTQPDVTKVPTEPPDSLDVTEGTQQYVTKVPTVPPDSLDVTITTGEEHTTKVLEAKTSTRPPTLRKGPRRQREKLLRVLPPCKARLGPVWVREELQGVDGLLDQNLATTVVDVERCVCNGYCDGNSRCSRTNSTMISKDIYYESNGKYVKVEREFRKDTACACQWVH